MSEATPTPPRAFAEEKRPAEAQHGGAPPADRPVRRRRITERQVLFRLDDALLAELDRKIAQSGYKTRNAWFKAVVERLVSESDPKGP